MAISFGPKLNLLYNALIGESYFDSLRLFLQSIDALVQGSVINATQSAPPSSPNGGDAYLLTGGTPSGAWTGQAGKIAVWDAQLTNSGTNTVVPGWVFLTPNAGWLIWNVALSGLIVYNGTTWGTIGGSGANFPTNTDITSMTGIPNTTISTSGYVYNDGTNPVTQIGTVTTGGAGPNAYQLGSGTFAAPTSGGTLIMGSGPWTGLAASGLGIGICNSSAASTVMTASGIQSSGTLESNFVNALTRITSQGSMYCDNYESYTPSTPMTFQNQGAIVGAGYTFHGNTSTSLNNLVGFVSYPTQTTVGAAGAASALPVTPSGYLQLEINGTAFVVPYYAQV